MTESEWKENYCKDLNQMVLAHKNKKLLYITNPSDALYNHFYPPEFRFALKNGEKIYPDESDDIYYFLLKQYYMATGNALFYNFQLKQDWRKEFDSLDWNRKTVSDFTKSFQKGTALLKRRRFHNVQELIEFHLANQ